MDDPTLTRYGQLAMRTRALLDAIEQDWGETLTDPTVDAAIDLLEQTEQRLSLYVSAMPSAAATPPSRAELQRLWSEAGEWARSQRPATDI